MKAHVLAAKNEAKMNLFLIIAWQVGALHRLCMESTAQSHHKTNYWDAFHGAITQHVASYFLAVYNVAIPKVKGR